MSSSASVTASESKRDAAGGFLRVPGFAAPFVAESRFRIGLELAELIDIPSNGTKLIVGRVTIVQVEESRLHADGSIHLEGLDVVASTALDTYFGITPLVRLPYAKATA